MVSLIPKGCYTIFEPTPGEGNLVCAILESERKFEAVYHRDFFLRDRTKKYDCILMNPPFSEKSAFLNNAPKGLKGMGVGYEILRQCMEQSDNIIALMPWFLVLDSDKRLRMLQQFGLKSVTALPRKTFNYARIQTAIFELQKDYKGRTEFRSLSL